MDHLEYIDYLEDDESIMINEHYVPLQTTSPKKVIDANLALRRMGIPKAPAIRIPRQTGIPISQEYFRGVKQRLT
jgi:hypothetical protein